MDITELKKKIVSEIRRDTNGAVVDAMRQISGDEKYMSYGVTLPAIKKIALEYHPNHELALSLFDSKIREAKLAAIYIDSPQDVTDKQMEHWAQSFDSQEIADNCATMLFWASDDALDTAIKWLKEKRNTTAALMMIGKRAIMAYVIDERKIYEQAIKIVIDNSIELSSRAVIYMLTSVAKADLSIKEIVVEAITTKAIAENIADEISWQIEL